MQHNEFNLLLWQGLSMHTAVPEPAFIQTCRGSWWRLHISLGWSLWPSGQWRSGSPAHDTGTEAHRAQLMTPHKQSWSLYSQGSKFLTAGMAWTEEFCCGSALAQTIFCLTYTQELLSSYLMRLLKNRKGFFLPTAGRKLPEFVAKGGCGGRQHQHI